MKAKLILIENPVFVGSGKDGFKKIPVSDNIQKRHPRINENFKRHQLKKAKDRRKLIRQIECLCCGETYDCKMKKVNRIKTRVISMIPKLELENYRTKEEEPLNQFCSNRIKCNSQHIAFRSKLAKMRMGDKDDKLVADYVTSKLLRRVPTKVLMPILESKMNPKYFKPKPFLKA